MKKCDELKKFWLKRFLARGIGKSLPRDCSPLRYPGGKGSLKYFLADAVFENFREHKTLIEPFCGGAGASIPLLVSGIVSELRLNDMNPAIANFWQSSIFDTDNFINLLLSTQVNIKTWQHYKSAIQKPESISTLEHGFAAFFLNRTNRSGLLIGGPIGGIKQNGKYKLDCRFNKEKLANRIKRIARYRDKIKISNLDAVEFLRRTPESALNDALVFLDPPYVKHGYNIYRKYSFSLQDHRKLAEYVKNKQWPWIITYDDETLIHDLYSERAKGVIEYSYYMQQAKIGRELILSSSTCRLSLPDSHAQQNSAGTMASTLQSNAKSSAS